MAFGNDATGSSKKVGDLKERLVGRYGTRPIGKGKERVVMEGGRRAKIYGCRKILVYSPTEIRLSLAKEELCVIGERLFCSSFSAGTVTVEGLVGGVFYRPFRDRLTGDGKGGRIDQ